MIVQVLEPKQIVDLVLCMECSLWMTQEEFNTHTCRKESVPCLPSSAARGSGDSSFLEEVSSPMPSSSS